jgi:hypothetical protein
MMFDVHCHHCERTYLVGTRSIVSFHDTSTGPIAYVRCPDEHLLIRNFRHQFTTPTVAGDEPTTRNLTPAAADLCGAVR